MEITKQSKVYDSARRFVFSVQCGDDQKILAALYQRLVNSIKQHELDGENNKLDKQVAGAYLEQAKAALEE